MYDSNKHLNIYEPKQNLFNDPDLDPDPHHFCLEMQPSDDYWMFLCFHSHCKK